MGSRTKDNKSNNGCVIVQCETTRLRSRLISVAYMMTSLGCLRQKPSFGCRYSTSFASISSNRNRDSFDSEELEPLKWYQSMWKRKSCFVWKATFSRAKSLKA